VSVGFLPLTLTPVAQIRPSGIELIAPDELERRVGDAHRAHRCRCRRWHGYGCWFCHRLGARRRHHRRVKNIALELQAIMDWARACALTRLALWAPDQNLGAMALYRRAGFRETENRRSLPTNETVRVVEMNFDISSAA